MAIKWTPDGILIRALGATGLAGVNAFLNNRTAQLVQLLRNGDMVDWLVILADLFNVAPDGTALGDALDAATDAAIFDLAHSLFANRLKISSIIPTFGGLGGLMPQVATPASTPASAAATGQPSPSTTQQGATQGAAPAAVTPIPAASSSAAGDVTLAGY